jgi:hypothetical protein
VYCSEHSVKKEYILSFGFLTVVTVKKTVVLDAMPSTLVEIGRRFGEMYCKIRQGREDKCNKFLRNIGHVSRDSILATLLAPFSCSPITSFLSLKKFIPPPFSGARGGVVVKALRYKPSDRGFDSRWCHWNFSVTFLPVPLWPWGRLSL